MIVIAVLGVVALVLPVTGASAHASWLTSTPAPGATVETAPAEVRVSFDSPLLDSGAALVVTNAEGVVISEPAPVIDMAEISVAVDPGAPPGAYTVAFRVVSEDGHTVSDSFSYTVSGAAPAASSAPSAAAPTTPAASAAAGPQDGPAPPVGSPVAQPAAQSEGDADGIPAWVWIIGAIGLIAIVLAVVGGRRRS